MQGAPPEQVLFLKVQNQKLERNGGLICLSLFPHPNLSLNTIDFSESQMQGSGESGVLTQMAERRLVCEREIPIQQRRVDSALSSYRKLFDSAKSEAQNTIHLQGKLIFFVCVFWTQILGFSLLICHFSLGNSIFR